VGLDQSIEKEGLDRESITFPGVQQQLLDTVVACANPAAAIVVVVMSGGPIDISTLRDNERIGAVFWVGYPGQAGGTALTNLLFGKSVPSGRLPHTVYPADFVDKVPLTDMNMRVDSATGNPGRTYRFYTGDAV